MKANLALKEGNDVERLPVEGRSGRVHLHDGGAGLDLPALTGDGVLILARHADSGPALAAAGVLVPPALEVARAVAFFAC